MAAKNTTLFFSFAFCLLVSISQAITKENSTNEIIIANDTCKLIDKYLTQLADSLNFSGGLLIIKDGTKIFSKGYGWSNREKKIPFTPSTLASMGSITKAFTAAAIMKLTEQGKLSPADSLKKFFPSVPPDKANITIHHLLTHSSGFHEFLNEDGGDYEKVETEEFLKRAFAEPLAFHPGEKAVYTNVGMSILGIIIEKVSGTDYETFLKENLFKTNGIHNIGYHVADVMQDSIAHGYQNGKDWGTIAQHISKAGSKPYWNLKANGGLEASLDDMYLWINAITNHTVLADTTIQKMFTAHVVEEGYGGQSAFGYGCTISKSRRGTKLIDNGGSNGIYFARLVRLPEEGVVFYLVTNESSINANTVLPNITQLYFRGSIDQDATVLKPKFETKEAETIYTILERTKTKDLSSELEKQNINVNDDMVLLEVGQRLIEERKPDEALTLYQFYTKTFPKIIVAWNDMGDVYQMKSNTEEAIKCYNQALKLKPDNQRAKENLEKLKH
ncbi:MAG TPA: serine hydrolase [Chitinophagaceae bacterium]|nr:serine hydrolase [Chitinophagaceae bacterium]